MAIAFVASESAASFTSNPTPTTCNVPAGTLDDHVMVAYVTINSGSAGFVPPAGWTLVDEIVSDVNDPMKSAIYTRVAASEPASYDWAHDNTNRWLAVIIQAWSGVNISTPMDAVYSQVLHTANHVNDPAPPNQPITTVTDGAEVIVFHHYRGPLDTVAAPTGYTLDPSSLNSSSRCLHVANRSIATAGVEAPGNWLHTDASVNDDSQVWTISLRPAGDPRTITDIDGDDDVQVGQASVTIACAGLDSAPATQTVTLGGESLTITDWNSGSPIVTIPVDIALKWGRTDLDLVVTDDTGSVTLNNVTLSAETGWEYVNFSGTVPGAGTESGYEVVQTDFTYNLTSSDQWIFESETGLSYDTDTIPTVNPAATITSQYRYWRDDTGAMSAKTAYTIAQKPTLTLGSFTAG